MAVLTASVQRPVRIPAGGITTAVRKLAGYTNFGAGTVAHTVYNGSIVVCDVSDTDGYFRAAPATGTTAAAVTSSDTADGSKLVTVAVDGEWGFAKGSLAITDVGADAYASDDQTITTTSSNNFKVGRITDVDGTYVWVDIKPYMLVAL